MFNLEKFGNLVIDKVLFETNYPILFTCVNNKQELFLCVCCQNNAEGKRWLLTKTNKENVINMLEDKISIREAFLKNQESQITVSFSDGIEVKEHNELEWGDNSIYLPKKGEYMEAEPGEFDEEIAYYQSKREVNLNVIVLEHDGVLNPIEIKKTSNPGTELVRVFELLDKSSPLRSKGAVICMNPGLGAIDRDNYIVPIWMI